MMKCSFIRSVLTLMTFLALHVQTCLALDDQPQRDPQIGQSFRIPYQLTDTNHFLVRVRLNGKGPFNFLVDSGAPTLYVTMATAAKLGLKTPAGAFWTPLDRLDLEGGARLMNLRARVEDPFQLVGMNALGLPGASIDGILGFTILARFRLQIDPTQDRMTWTRLAFAPPDPPVPRPEQGQQDRPPLDFQAMNLLGPLAKALAFVVGKQPTAQRTPRGFLGLEWSEHPVAARGSEKRPAVHISRILEGSPCARSDLQPGDEVVSINGEPINDIKQARGVLATIRPGGTVKLLVRRDPGTSSTKPAGERTITITAGEGL